MTATDGWCTNASTNPNVTSPHHTAPNTATYTSLTRGSLKQMAGADGFGSEGTLPDDALYRQR